ncbi:hypothetical protein CVU76_00235 [Candidatus Dojkabacteria bacterium HGW-Dojkabacteria-1]|uniref:Uncharacterized protein n=1 Tax=Candidatus Dojkabacteria bacterium HGW-Dojkabacteria-1 TaxID=2013761 RepID=A0A2N2F2P6_9BACT|nr:MAG: hypothetical protein CVU76_00235 [Candidatus Dojkabacteria bacterium HGW-Dojkabacteria-1]
MEEKTYRERNIKFLLSLVFLLVFSVVILLYLLSLGTFLPFNVEGDYDLLNISVFTMGSFIFLSSALSLIAYAFSLLILKKENTDIVKTNCVKFGILLTIGIFLVVLLNFFHILDIFWGVGILLVLVIASFVI